VTRARDNLRERAKDVTGRIGRSKFELLRSTAMLPPKEETTERERIESASKEIAKTQMIRIDDFVKELC